MVGRTGIEPAPAFDTPIRAVLCLGQTCDGHTRGLLLLRRVRLLPLRVNQIDKVDMPLITARMRRIRDNVPEVLLERIHTHVHVRRSLIDAHDLLLIKRRHSQFLPVREVLHGLQLVVADDELEHLRLHELVRGQMLVK